MKDLTPLERRMAAHMLRLAEDTFGNHGCSDLDLRSMKLTDAEIAELHQKMAEFNRSPEDVISGHIVPDWYLMAYLAHLLDPEVPRHS
jgi:hypothetical protein